MRRERIQQLRVTKVQQMKLPCKLLINELVDVYKSNHKMKSNL